MWQNKRCFRFFSKDGGKTWHDVDKETVHAVQEAVTIIGHDKLVKLFEEYLPGGKEKQVWFKMQETKWKYFYDMVYKHMPKDDQFAKDVLETIKRKKYWCSQRQYDYLKRAVGGENNPGTYGTKN